VFDAAGTLMRPRPDFSRVFADVAADFGLALSESQIVDRFAVAFGEVDWHDANEAQHLQFWRQIVSRVFTATDEIEPIFKQLWQHFASPQAWTVYEDVVPAWRAIQARGMQIAIGSNFDQRLPQICAGHPILAECEHVFWSAALAAAKPHQSFFRAVASRLHSDPERLLMVGDDWINDYLGARDAGWQAVWLNRDDRPLPDKQAPSIQSLTDLLALVDSC
jgi:putative hydrolase of the HAD superfamily